MFNLYDRIKNDPGFYRQLHCGEALITRFQCLLRNKYEETWSHLNYFVYVVEGRKIWHTADGSYNLQKGDCALVRKGAGTVEQFFDTEACFIFFFMPDAFIADALKNKPMPVTGRVEANMVIPVHDNAMVQAFFLSMMPYFESQREPGQSLLELKFRELVLTLADDSANTGLYAYFYQLLHQPRTTSLQQVMEENFFYNLGLEAFARLSARSLSAFKRDFESIYHTTPGKWLLEKRLNHARYLLSAKGRTVSEAAFESGFENASHFSRVFRQRFGMPPAAVKLQTPALLKIEPLGQVSGL